MRTTARPARTTPALKTHSQLEWEGNGERFTNNEAANRLLFYKYRAPYKLA